MSSGSAYITPYLYSELLLLAMNTPNLRRVFTSRQCQSFQLNFIDASTPHPPLYDIIYLLTAIGLIPCSSSTVHIYTQTINRTKQ